MLFSCNHDDENISPYFDLAVAKRPEYEFYNVQNDPYCLNNLFGNSDYEDIETEMKEALLNELVKSEDPRVVGSDTGIFDSYIRYSPMREFPHPDE